MLLVNTCKWNLSKNRNVFQWNKYVTHEIRYYWESFIMYVIFWNLCFPQETSVLLYFSIIVSNSNNSNLHNVSFLLHIVVANFVHRNYVGKLWWHLKTRKFWPEWLASSAHQAIMWSRKNFRINRFQNNDALVDGLHVLEED